MEFMFEAGEVLAGKYRVERVLGQGGMGVVLAARHLHLDEPVAVKLMLSDTGSNPEAAARFVREARAAARLQSAHVARVSDVGTLDDGRAYMVMEYLEGSDLAQLLERGGPLTVGDAVDYVLQASEAIAEAHSLGIVHRDLKPSNLFLTTRRDRTPHIKVLDFGISKVEQTGTTASVTQTSAMMGSPLYMSPEQMTSARDVDGRADIWALGVVLYELLTALPPFDAETLPQICGLVLQAEAPKLRERRADAPAELEAVILRCLAKQPADRYQDVTALAVALRDLAGPFGLASVERILLLAGDENAQRVSADHARDSAGVGARTAPEPGKATNAAWGDARAHLPVRRSPLWLAGSLGLAALLGVVAWWFTSAKLETAATPVAASSRVSAAPPLAVAPPPPEAIAEPAASLAAEPSLSAVSAFADPPAAQLTLGKNNVTRDTSPHATTKRAAAAAKPPVHDSTPAPSPPTAVVAPVAPLAAPPKKPIGLGGRL